MQHRDGASVSDQDHPESEAPSQQYDCRVKECTRFAIAVLIALDMMRMSRVAINSVRRVTVIGNNDCGWLKRLTGEKGKEQMRASLTESLRWGRGGRTCAHLCPECTGEVARHSRTFLSVPRNGGLPASCVSCSNYDM